MQKVRNKKGPAKLNENPAVTEMRMKNAEKKASYKQMFISLNQSTLDESPINELEDKTNGIDNIGEIDEEFINIEKSVIKDKCQEKYYSNINSSRITTTEDKVKLCIRDYDKNNNQIFKYKEEKIKASSNIPGYFVTVGTLLLTIFSSDFKEIKIKNTVISPELWDTIFIALSIIFSLLIIWNIGKIIVYSTKLKKLKILDENYVVETLKPNKIKLEQDINGE